MDETDQQDTRGHRQVCIDLEKATQGITQALQHEVMKNQDLWRLIRRLEDKEAETGRSLAEQVEANKQLQQKISRLHKHLEEKHSLLTQANQNAASLTMELSDLRQQLENQHGDRSVKGLSEWPQHGENQLKQIVKRSCSLQSKQLPSAEESLIWSEQLVSPDAQSPLVSPDAQSPLVSPDAQSLLVSQIKEESGVDGYEECSHSEKVDLIAGQTNSSAEDVKTEWIQVMERFELKVIVPDQDIQELSLDKKPKTVEELEVIVRERCHLQYSFTMMYEDPVFGNALSCLDSMEDVPSVATVLVVPEPTSTPSVVPEPTTTPSVALELSNYTSVDPKLTSYASVDLELPCMSPDISMNSVNTVATPSSRTQIWPKVFNIPSFSADVEQRLRQANESYRRSRRTLTCSLSMKRKMLRELAKEIYKYTAYPTKERLAVVAQALIAKHPCLSEVGSPDGCSGWKNSLYFKMGNFRNRKLKAELHRRPRKPKRCEVGCVLPEHPGRMNEHVLEEARILLVEEMKRRKPKASVILPNMSQTFSLRRREIVQEGSPVGTLKERWPALFTQGQVFAEFYRITAANLNVFFEALDHYTPRLVALFKTKRGTIGETLHDFLQQTDLKRQDVTGMRTLVLRGLPVLLGDDPSGFYNTCLVTNRGDAWAQISIGLLTVIEKGILVGPNLIHLEPVSTAIVIEGCCLMNDLQSFPEAVCVLFGLLYILNLDYPKSMKNTLNFIQRVLLGLGQNTLSPKLQSLKNLLLTRR